MADDRLQQLRRAWHESGSLDDLELFLSESMRRGEDSQAKQEVIYVLENHEFYNIDHPHECPQLTNFFDHYRNPMVDPEVTARTTPEDISLYGVDRHMIVDDEDRMPFYPHWFEEWIKGSNIEHVTLFTKWLREPVRFDFDARRKIKTTKVKVIGGLEYLSSQGESPIEVVCTGTVGNIAARANNLSVEAAQIESYEYLGRGAQNCRFAADRYHIFPGDGFIEDPKVITPRQFRRMGYLSRDSEFYLRDPDDSSKKTLVKRT